jgi:alpha-tubulin suppressor-like RCC1 family protein
MLGALAYVSPSSGQTPLTNVAQVSAGGYATCALESGGTVKCWGRNTHGQLGISDTSAHPLPQPITQLSNAVVQLSAGSLHTCALMNDARVKCWGRDNVGQLGNGATSGEQWTAQSVVTLNAVWQLVSGSDFNCAQRYDGTALCWGNNYSGQSGTGYADTALQQPYQVYALSNASQLAAGGSHACALTGSGVYCWGNNTYGQLGLGNTDGHGQPQRVTALAGVTVTRIAAGGNHTCAIDDAAVVRCWGANDYGQLGLDNTANQWSPQVVPGLAGATQLALGTRHTCARTSAGVLCTGSNSAGQLGLGDTTSRSSPVLVSGLTSVAELSAGFAHTCARETAGTVRCWGDNFYGQLGDGSKTTALSPVQVLVIAPTQLAIPTITPASPTFGGTFSVTIEARDSSGTARSVTSNTLALLSVQTGSGTLSGTASCTIMSGNSSCTASGLTYGKAENGVVLRASASSGMTLSPGDSAAFNVQKASQSTTFGSLANKTMNDSPVTVSATATSGLAVAFTSDTASTCITGGSNGTSVTLVATGTCTLRAGQAGNGDHLPAADVTQSFTITQGTQAITGFSPPASKTLGDAAFDVDAGVMGGASGNPVTYAAQTTSVCTTGGSNGKTVTLVGAGTCTVRASQAGNANYAAAPDVDRNISVGKAATTLTITGPGAPSTIGNAITVSLGLANTPNRSSPAYTGTITVNATQGAGSVGSCRVPAAATATCNLTVNVVGAITLTASWPGDANYSAPADGTRSHTVNAIATTTTAYLEVPGVKVYGEPVAISARVVAASGSTSPSGTVSISVGGVSCSAAVSQVSGATGSASCTLTGNPAVGAGQAITATYNPGSTSYASSTSNSASLTVGTASTSTVLTASPTTSTAGASTTLSARITANSPSVATPSGTLEFRNGGETIAGCSAQPLDARGIGTCAITFTSPGERSLTAVYTPTDTRYSTSQSSTLNHPVNVAASTTSITLVSPAGSQSYGTAFTISVSVAGTVGIPTGTVTLTASTATCTLTLGNGTGSCSLTPPAGTTQVSATYNGDAIYGGSGATPASISVSQAAQAISGFNPPASKTLGEAAFDIDGGAIGGASGNPVTFASQTPAVCTTGGTNGKTVTLIGAGTCTVRASQAGNANYAAATGVDRNISVGKAATTLSITGSGSPSILGNVITVSMRLANTPNLSNPAYTGTITVNATQGPGNYGSCSVAAAATATCSITLNEVGAITLTASWPGDANYSAPADGTRSHTVNAIATTTTVSQVSPAPSTFGQAVTVVATVVATSGVTSPDGTVVFSVGGDSCTGTVAHVSGTTGQANCALTGNPTAGANQAVAAAYTPRTRFYTASTDSSARLTINAASTSIGLASGANPTLPGANVTFTATVSAIAPGGGTPAGSVIFTVDGVAGSPRALVAGVATLDLSSLAVGSHVLTASYTPANGNHASSVSTPLSHTVNTAASSTSLSLLTPDPTFGSPVEVGASVTGQGTPSGTVQVSSSIGVGCTITLSGGSGRCTLSGLGGGDTLLTGTYSGDTLNAASSVTLTISLGKQSQSIVASTFADRPIGGSFDVVGFAASSGLAVRLASLTPGTCAFDPPMFSPSLGFQHSTRLNLLAVGTCTIEATQAGDHRYHAAPAITRSFNITPACDVQQGSQDCDGDGIPNGLEAARGRNPLVKDNDIFSDPALFVEQMYRDVFGREASASEVAAWSREVASGALTRAEVMRRHIISVEHAAARGPLVRLYFANFLRIPDYAGLTFWTNAYRSGQSLISIADAFASSPEFATRYGTLSNRDYVRQLYRNILNREPDAAGWDDWTGRLDRMQQSRGAVQVGFSESQEYLRAIDNEVLITLAYAALLKREPDAARFNEALGAIDGGMTYTTWLASLLAGVEYRARFLP